MLYFTSFLGNICHLLCLARNFIFLSVDILDVSPDVSSEVKSVWVFLVFEFHTLHFLDRNSHLTFVCQNCQFQFCELLL